MLYLDVARILIGVIFIVAAGYGSAAAANISNNIVRIVAKFFAFAIMIAGALQISFVINAYA